MRTSMQGFLRDSDLKAIRGCSTATNYRDVARGLLTRPVRISLRASGWPQAEIEAINTARIGGATDDEIRALVRQLEAARKESARTEHARVERAVS